MTLCSPHHSCSLDGLHRSAFPTPEPQRYGGPSGTGAPAVRGPQRLAGPQRGEMKIRRDGERDVEESLTPLPSLSGWGNRRSVGTAKSTTGACGSAEREERERERDRDRDRDREREKQQGQLLFGSAS